MIDKIVIRCPYCDAELQENARFCLYCMNSLDEKSEHRHIRIKGKRIYIWIAACLVAVCLVGSIVYILTKYEKAQTQTPEDSLMDYSTETTTEENELLPLIFYDDFYWRCVFYSQEMSLEDLWSAESMYYAGQTATANQYVAKVHLDGVSFSAYFIDDGVKILTVISGIKESDLQDGIELANCTIYGVYNCDDMYLSTTDPFPKNIISLEKLSACALGLRDLSDLSSESDRVFRDKIMFYNSFDPLGEYYMLYELHERTVQGQKYYDIYLTHIQQ